MMTKLIKTLELHFAIIQFVIEHIIMLQMWHVEYSKDFQKLGKWTKRHHTMKDERWDTFLGLSA